MSSAIETLEANLKDNLNSVNTETTDPSEPQAAIDVVLIISIIQGILQAFSACKGGTTAGIQEAQSRSNRVERLTRARLIQEEYGTLRNYRQKGGSRVLRATLNTMCSTPAETLEQAVEEFHGDLNDSGAVYDFA